jgi:hypothetical protein
MDIEAALRWVDNNCYDEVTVNRLRSLKVARILSDEVERLRNQLEAGRSVVNLGINLMTTEQVGRWVGVRHFLEAETEMY